MPDNSSEVTANIEEEEVQNPKRIHRMSKRAMHRWIRFFSLASVVLAAVFTLTVIMAFNHYKTYPGVVERDSLSSPGRGSDYIVVSWDETHSTDVYKVWVKERELVMKDLAKAEEEAEPDEEVLITPDKSWREYKTEVPEITVRDLEDDTSYSFIVRADNEKKKGVATQPRSFKTKKVQKIKVNKTITKFTFSKPFKLGSAETDLIYESSDPDVASVDPETNEIEVNGE